MDKDIPTLQTKLTQLNAEIYKIDQEIAKDKLVGDLYAIVGEYAEIDDWEDIFNIGDINDVEIQDILKSDTPDFGDIISQTIGRDDYEEKTEYEKTLLNMLFVLIKDYVLVHEIAEKDIKLFLKKHDEPFLKYVQNILQSLI